MFQLRPILNVVTLSAKNLPSTCPVLLNEWPLYKLRLYTRPKLIAAWNIGKRGSVYPLSFREIYIVIRLVRVSSPEVLRSDYC